MQEHQRVHHCKIREGGPLWAWVRCYMVGVSGRRDRWERENLKWLQRHLVRLPFPQTLQTQQLLWARCRAKRSTQMTSSHPLVTGGESPVIILILEIRKAQLTQWKSGRLRIQAQALWIWPPSVSTIRTSVRWSFGLAQHPIWFQVGWIEWLSVCLSLGFCDVLWFLSQPTTGKATCFPTRVRGTEVEVFPPAIPSRPLTGSARVACLPLNYDEGNRISQGWEGSIFPK